MTTYMSIPKRFLNVNNTRRPFQISTSCCPKVPEVLHFTPIDATYASVTTKTGKSKYAPVHSNQNCGGCKIIQHSSKQDQKVIIGCYTNEDLTQVAKKLKTSQARLKVDEAVK